MSGEEQKMVSKDEKNGLTQRRVHAEHHLEPVVESLTRLTKHVNPPVPNPAPLGLIAFGFTTCLLQMKHTRLTGSDPEDLAGVVTVVSGFAMFFGGLLQIIAGINEIRRDNIFGYTAFCVYGGFWMSMSTITIVTLLSTSKAAVNAQAMQAMLFLLGIVSLMFWVLTFKLNKTICSLFFLLTVTCFLLSFGVPNTTVDTVGGWFGIITSANAFWLAFVELVNDVIGEGKEIIPVGKWQWNRNDEHDAGGVFIAGHIQGQRLSLFNTVPPAHNHGETSSDATGDVLHV